MAEVLEETCGGIQSYYMEDRVSPSPHGNPFLFFLDMDKIRLYWVKSLVW